MGEVRRASAGVVGAVGVDSSGPATMAAEPRPERRQTRLGSEK